MAKAKVHSWFIFSSVGVIMGKEGGESEGVCVSFVSYLYVLCDSAFVSLIMLIPAEHPSNSQSLTHTHTHTPLCTPSPPPQPSPPSVPKPADTPGQAVGPSDSVRLFIKAEVVIERGSD